MTRTQRFLEWAARHLVRAAVRCLMVAYPNTSVHVKAMVWKPGESVLDGDYARMVAEETGDPAWMTHGEDR